MAKGGGRYLWDNRVSSTTGGVSVTDEAVDVISSLWVMYILMVTAEPDENVFSKYDQLYRPRFD